MSRTGRARPFTFGFPPGTVLGDDDPAGYSRLHRTAVVGPATAFAAASDAVLDWAVQRRSGIAVRLPSGGDAARAEPGLAVGLVIPIAGPFAVRAPARVSVVVDDPDVRGFVYGTLPGHPERGEEAFLVRRVGEATVFELRALSRPAFPYSLAAPILRAFQRRFTERYVGTLLAPPDRIGGAGAGAAAGA